MATKTNNPMKVITGKETRWSYANVWEAKSINGGAPKFSVSLMWSQNGCQLLTELHTSSSTLG